MYIPPRIYITMLIGIMLFVLEFNMKHFQCFGVYISCICHQIYSYVIKYILKRDKFWLLDLDLHNNECDVDSFG